MALLKFFLFLTAGCLASAAQLDAVYCPGRGFFNPTTGLCYYFANTTDSWNNAVSYCIDTYGIYAQPATPKNAYEEQFVYEVYQASGASVGWLGASSNANGLFTDIRGSTLIYNNWDIGQPAMRSSCVVMAFNGTWESIICSVNHNYICQVPTNASYIVPTHPPAGNCPQYSSVLADGMCYFETNIGVQWATGSYSCRQLGLSLAIPVNAFDNNYVNMLFQAQGFSTMWLGAYSDENGRWYDIDGNLLSYTNWMPGEPKYGTNSFAQMLPDGRWSSFYGNKTLSNYLCRIKVNGTGTEDEKNLRAARYHIPAN